MHSKKLHRKCSVRGCKNTESFVISLTRELGGSVIICRECLEKALAVTEGKTDTVTDNKSHKRPRALFFNEKALYGISDNTDENTVEKSVESEPIETHAAEFICHLCGKTFKSASGLSKHIELKHNEGE